MENSNTKLSSFESRCNGNPHSNLRGPIGDIQRKPNPNDRRAILIELTDKGRETARDLEAIIPQANQEFLEGFSAEEQMMLKGLLNRARKR